MWVFNIITRDENHDAVIEWLEDALMKNFNKSFHNRLKINTDSRAIGITLDDGKFEPYIYESVMQGQTMVMYPGSFLWIDLMNEFYEFLQVLDRKRKIDEVL